MFMSLFMFMPPPLSLSPRLSSYVSPLPLSLWLSPYISTLSPFVSLYLSLWSSVSPLSLFICRFLSGSFPLFPSLRLSFYITPLPYVSPLPFALSPSPSIFFHLGFLLTDFRRKIQKFRLHKNTEFRGICDVHMNSIARNFLGTLHNWNHFHFKFRNPQNAKDFHEQPTVNPGYPFNAERGRLPDWTEISRWFSEIIKYHILYCTSILILWSQAWGRMPRGYF